MALFIMNHSKEKIMILGRWGSDAFMSYIRPQVLEWTNIMAADMASVKSFMDLNDREATHHRRRETDWSELSIMPVPYLGR